MKKTYSILKYLLTISMGIIWGIVSFYWLVYSILILGNMMEEPGSYDYELEGEPMRIWGLLGCITYAVVFIPLLFLLKKKKKYMIVFILSMLLGGGGTLLYIVFLKPI